MAHFAKIVDNRVVNVVVVDDSVLLDDDGVEQEALGIAYLTDLLGHDGWVQTSYNGSTRRKYAGIGNTYNAELDAFFTAEEASEMEVVEWQE